MSYSKQITIWCDQCGNWVMFSVNSVREARRLASLEGWIRRKDQDLCSLCTKEKKK